MMLECKQEQGITLPDRKADGDSEIVKTTIHKTRIPRELPVA